MCTCLWSLKSGLHKDLQNQTLNIRLGLCVREYVILRITCQSECQYKFVYVITGSGTLCGDAE